MTETYDRDSWERRWSQALRAGVPAVARRPPNKHVLSEAADLRPDLVICLYVHVAGVVSEMVGRLAAGVAPGGTLLLVGHRPVDPATGAPTLAAGQVQVSVEAAVAALDPGRWEILVAEDRPREAAGSGVDAVVRATCRRS